MTYIDVLKQPNVNQVDYLIGISNNEVKQIPAGTLNEIELPAELFEWDNDKRKTYLESLSLPARFKLAGEEESETGTISKQGDYWILELEHYDSTFYEGALLQINQPAAIKNDGSLETSVYTQLQYTSEQLDQQIQNTSTNLSNQIDYTREYIDKSLDFIRSVGGDITPKVDTIWRTTIGDIPEAPIIKTNKGITTYIWEQIYFDKGFIDRKYNKDIQRAYAYGDFVLLYTNNQHRVVALEDILNKGRVDLILEYNKPVDFNKVTEWYNNQGSVYIKYTSTLLPACSYASYDPEYGWDRFDAYATYSYISSDDDEPRPISVAVVAYDGGRWIREQYVPTSFLSYEEQTLTDEQKEQVRTNIEAASKTEFDALQKFDIIEHYRLSYETDIRYDQVGEYTDQRITLFKPLIITHTQDYYSYIRVNHLTQAQYNALDAAVLAKFPSATGDITGVYEYFYGNHKINTEDSIANYNMVIKGDKIYVIA